MKVAVLLVIVLSLLISAVAYAEVGVSKTDPFAASNGALVVTVSASGSPITDVLSSLASQSKQKILVETSVKGNLTQAVNEKTLEAALSAVCKSAKLTWRKIYIDPKSDLIEKPDRLAAVLRLMTGMSFPDVVVSRSSTDKVGLVCQQKQGVEGVQDKIVTDLGMEPVYLVSNDATVAARQGADAAVNSYNKMAKDQLDLFMKMTPEEREQAMLENLNMMENMGPEYYASMTQALLNSDPEAIRRMQKRSNDFLFSMPQDQRRALLKMSMQGGSPFTPEQMKILQDDTAAIQAELKNAQTGQPQQ